MPDKHNDATDSLLETYMRKISSALQIPSYPFGSDYALTISDDDSDLIRSLLNSVTSEVAAEINQEILNKLPSAEITPNTELKIEQLEIYLKVMAGKEDKEEIRFYHEAFSSDEYLSLSPTDGFIYDEDGNLFENWDLSDNIHNGIRSRKDSELFQSGWYIYD